MRLIDADAMIEKIKAKATEMFTINSVYEYYIYALIDVEDIIKAEPTATERKMGEWQAVNLDVRAWTVQCSNCNCIGLYGKTAFCPNCGADMRGE